MNHIDPSLPPTLGIVVSGGPAPGINSVISAATIEAHNRGWQVRGFVGGFQGACLDNEPLRDLKISDVSRIALSGGSILGTSRCNPLIPADTLSPLLRANQISKLIVIGGEGSAYLSAQIAEKLPFVAVAHVPKTIDNDLVLPNHHPSFGFETARQVGTDILDTLMVDAETCRRWYVVTTMGRRAGFLALGLGLAAGATLTIIPEEFGGRKIALHDIASIIVESICLRRAAGKTYGLALLAEGLLELLDPNSPELQSAARDDLGRISLSNIELGDIILPAVYKGLAERGIAIKCISKNIGYELRCHSPSSFDVEYTKFLGHGAVHLLAGGQSNFMVTRSFDRLTFEPLRSIVDARGNIKARQVDIESDLYRVARRFMIR